MFTPTQAALKLKSLREKNPQLSSYSDDKLIDMYHLKTGTNDFAEYKNANSLVRLAGQSNAALKGLTSDYIIEPLDRAFGSSPDTENNAIVSDIAGGIAESAPELGILGLGALTAVPTSGGSLLIAVPAAAGLSALRNYADTSDVLSSAATGASMLATGGLASTGARAGQAALQSTIKKAAPKLAARLSTPLAEKLAAGAGSYAFATAGQLPAETLAYTGDPDASVADRVLTNIKRLASPRGAATYFGSDLGFGALGLAAEKGAKNAKQILSNRGKLKGVGGSSVVGDYEGARKVLEQRGIKVEDFYPPAVVMDVADTLQSGVKYFDNDWANYELVKSAFVNESATNFVSDEAYNSGVNWIKRTDERRKEVARDILVGTLPLKDKLGFTGTPFENLMSFINADSLEQYARNDYARATELFDAVENLDDTLARKALGNQVDNLPTGYDRTKALLAEYRKGNIDAETLTRIHPDLGEIALTGDGLVFDLFKDKKLAQAAATNAQAFQKNMEELRKQVDMQSRAAEYVKKFVDFEVENPMPAQGTEAPMFRFADNKKEAVNFFERSIMADLQLALRYPETRGAFNIARGFKQQGRAKFLEHFQTLGQNLDNTLDPYTALKNAEDWINSNNGEELAKFAKAFAQEHKRAQQKAGLLTEQELSDVFKLNAEELHRYKALRELPMKLATEELRTQRQIDQLGLTKVVYLASGKKLSMDYATNFAKQVNDYVDALPRYPKGDKRLSTTQQQIHAFVRTLADNYGLKLDTDTVEKIGTLADVLKYNRELVISKRSELGYLPTIRRGVYGGTLVTPEGRARYEAGEPAKDGDVFTVDGNNKNEIERKIQEYQEKGYKVLHAWDKKEKEKIGQNVYAFDELESLRKEQANNIKFLADKYRAEGKLSPMDEQFLFDLQNLYNPLEDAYQAAVSTTQQYDLQRKNIAGFREEQFVPNILDYARAQSNAQQRRLAKAQLAVEMEKPAYDAVPGLKEAWAEKLQYAFGKDNAKVNKLREAVVHFYLALSPRNMALQTTQNVMTGMGPMTLHTGSIKSASRAIVNGGKLMSKYITTGTTGNTYLDRIIKQADHDGVTASTEHDLWLDSKTLENMGERRSRVKKASTKVLDNVERLLRSSSAFMERQNRLWSITSMADYELKKLGKTKKRLTEAELERIYKLAIQYSDDVNFVGDRANRPGFIKKAKSGFVHDSLLVATTMQSFAINYVGQLYAIGKRAKLSRNKALLGAVGVLLAASGGMGLPGAKDAEQALSQLFGTSVEAKLRGALLGDNPSESSEALADTLMYGLPTLFGFDASQSLGLGTLLNYNAGESPGENIFGTASGATGSMIGKFALAANDLIGGNYEQAYRRAMPQTLRYITRLADATTKNRTVNTEGIPSRKAISGRGTAALLAGFTPWEQSRQSKSERLKYTLDKSLSEQKQDMVDKIARDYIRGDREGAKEKLAQLVADLGPEQDERALLNSIEERIYVRRSGYALNSISLQDAKTLAQIKRAYPSEPMALREPVSALLNKTEVAADLGSPFQVAHQLQNLPQAFRSQVIKELLLQAGMTPQVWELAQSPSIASQDRLFRLLSEQSPALNVQGYELSR